VLGAALASTAAQVLVLGVISAGVGRLLNVPPLAQLGALRSFGDAVAVGSGAYLLQASLGGELSPVLRSAAALVAATVGVAALGRLRRRSGLATEDVAAICRALPNRLRRPFTIAVRVFSLQTR
jgi:hypothetical protein